LCAVGEMSNHPKETVTTTAGRITFGIFRIKSLARSFIWLPGLDVDVEKLVTDCEPCKVTAAMPTPVASYLWQHPSTPWERIHIDYGEWNILQFLVVVDAFSKWPEVKLVSSTTSQMTIIKLSKIFAVFGFPQILVSDNVPKKYLCLLNLKIFCNKTTLLTVHLHPTTPQQMALQKTWLKM